MKKGLVLCLAVLLSISFVAAQDIQIKGKILDQLTGEPLEGVRLFSDDIFSPEEIITNSNGEFTFNTNTDFERVGRWSFIKNCYEYGDIMLSKNHEVYAEGESGLIRSYNLALIKPVFGKGDVIREVEGEDIIDVGELVIAPAADINAKSDIPFESASVSWVSLDEGAHGKSGYSKEHLIQKVPIGHPLYITFSDQVGNEINSGEYIISEDNKCKTIVLKYNSEKDKSKWYVKTPGFFGGIINWFKEVF